MPATAALVRGHKKSGEMGEDITQQSETLGFTVVAAIGHRGETREKGEKEKETAEREREREREGGADCGRVRVAAPC